MIQRYQVREADGLYAVERNKETGEETRTPIEDHLHNPNAERVAPFTPRGGRAPTPEELAEARPEGA